jgi:protein-disulfide isomerase-like protein with CxxC motif
MLRALVASSEKRQGFANILDPHPTFAKKGLDCQAIKRVIRIVRVADNKRRNPLLTAIQGTLYADWRRILKTLLFKSFS